MALFKRIFSALLNPRANLDKVPHSYSQDDSENGYEAPAGGRGGIKPRDILLNFPLMTGAIIVLALFLLVLFGPVWAPQNPYITGQHIVPHYDFDLKEYIDPPLPPSAEYPLGTNQFGSDLLSMLMHGARNTLIACAFITMTRLIIGTFLGGLAGWRPGSLADRVVMGAIGVITSVPLLVSSMILIYALDIRRGLSVFIVALSVIGWTEIAQYIRSEFLVLREAPYIEGARAVGLRGGGVAVRHILPNVLPQLLIITFLEMGAVLMLLGELGFVGVYIGGGTQAVLKLDIGQNVTGTMIDVPEWGAMLAEGFRWLRSRPFVVFPSAIAFFVSVLGFTSLGEGLRRLIERFSVNTAFLLRKEMLLVIVGLTAATVFIINNTGPAPWITKVAQAFNGELAYEHTRVLTEMEGRRVGQEGGDMAAAYIAEKFESYGVNPGWEHNEYIYQIETQMVEPVSQPYMALVDAGGNVIEAYQHQIDFGFVIEGHGGTGDVQYPLTFIGFSPDTTFTWETFKGLDLRDRIVVLVRDNAPSNFATEALIRGARGVLWVTGDHRDDVTSQYQSADPDKDYLLEPGMPIYRIRPHILDTILAQDGLTVADLFSTDENVDEVGPGWFRRDLSSQVHMSLALSPSEPVTVPIVMGYIPGSDLSLFHEMIVVFVQYDGLGVDPDGTLFPAANHNASGVGTLLELARLWQEEELDTRRSVLLVAWGGVALDQELATNFIEDASNFRFLTTPTMNGRVIPWMILQLDYAGTGGDTLLVDSNSQGRVTETLVETAAEVQVPVEFVTDAGIDGELVADQIPGIYLQWSDAEVPTPDQDVFARISADKLQNYGETVTLLLTKLVRLSEF